MPDVKPIPDGYPRLSPGLAVDDASAAIEFYRDVFGATERMRVPRPGGKIMHAELQIVDSVLMVNDEAPEIGSLGPRSVGGTPVVLSVYVEDVDATFARALELGAKEIHPITNQFYGDRSGGFEDPWGHKWYVATHVEDVSEEDMAARMADMMGGTSP